MITAEQLGFTQEELQEKVVEKLCNEMLQQWAFDEDGDPFESKSSLAHALSKAVQKRIDDAVAKFAEKHVLPNAEKHIEDIVMQRTNEWGEAKGEPVTFKEYLVEAAEHYLTEKVDFDGKSKRESWGSFNGKQTRITYLVHRHLQYSIESAMKEALKTANSKIAEGIQETVKIKLQEVVKGLKAKVEIPR